MAGLVNARCLACGEAHDFCHLDGEPVEVGEIYVYICPRTSKPARLRFGVEGQFVRRIPPGAVMISRVQPGIAPLLHRLHHRQAAVADRPGSAA